MKPLTLKSRVGADGVLSVAIPMGQAEANQEVVFVVRRVTGVPSVMGAEAWQRFVRRHAGAIADPAFTRHEQGEYEGRVPGLAVEDWEA